MVTLDASPLETVQSLGYLGLGIQEQRAYAEYAALQSPDTI
jgi:hypothetical protein